MKMHENFKLAMVALKANKLRTFMTMLGIIIGIGSVIAILNVGDAIAKKQEKSLLEYGMRNLTVMTGPKMSDDDSYEEIKCENVKLSTIDDYLKKYENLVDGVFFQVSTNNITFNKKNKKIETAVIAVNEDYRRLHTDGYKLLYGRDLEKKDIEKKRYVCLVEKSFVKDYFGYANLEKALGEIIDLPVDKVTKSFEIVGIYNDKSRELYNYGVANGFLIPYSTYFSVTGSEETVQNLNIVPKEDVDLDLFSNTSTAYFKSLFKSSTTTEINVYSGNSTMKSLESFFGQVKLGLGAIAFISLLVGGIGVMNIMMVSVTERTREIGIRMALGAKTKEILSQFVIEAISICLIGGIIGAIIGIGAGYLVSSLAFQTSVSPTLETLFVSVGFSTAIGVFFGYYPAKKASDMDPIDALRYE